MLISQHFSVHICQGMEYIHTIVAQRGNSVSEKDAQWNGGEVILGKRAQHGRIKNQILSFLHDLKTIRLVGSNFDLIQVRNKIILGIAALLTAMRYNIPFFYWMSFPYPEDDLEWVHVQGLSLGWSRLLATWLRGILTSLILYYFLLPRSDHVFVQSDRMKKDLIAHGISANKITPVTMGVDLEIIQKSKISKIDDHRLNGKRVIVYLGALDKTRRIDFLFEVLAKVCTEDENAILLLVGDAAEASDIEWLNKRAIQLGVEEAIIWLGWLPREIAWRYVRTAEVGVSPIPPGYIYDCSSPTKAGEYLALGLPVVVNEQPDQAKIILESGGGFCVKYEIKDFSEAILKILRNRELAIKMGQKGSAYIRKNRSYHVLSIKLAKRYKELLPLM